MKLLNVLILVLIISIGNSKAQTKSEFKTKLDTVIEHISNNNTYDGDFRIYSDKFPEFVIEKTKKYLNDPDDRFHHFAINVISDAALRSKKISVRQEGVFQLLNTYVYSFNDAVKNLERFNKEDFNSKSKDSLISFLSQKAKRMEIIKFIGFLGMTEQISTLKSFFESPEVKGAFREEQLKWKINVTLARLGDSTAINECINIAKLSGCDKQAVYRLFPDLIYTKNKTIFDYLVSVLHDTSAETGSANPNSNNMISCGYRVMELFPGIIEGYPLEYSFGSQIKTNNYKEALEIARKWFIDNPDYKINKNLF